MKLMTLIGTLLITLGLIVLVFEDFTLTSNSDAISAGEMNVQIHETRHIPYTPITGGLAIFAGVILIVVDQRRQPPSKAS